MKKFIGVFTMILMLGFVNKAKAQDKVAECIYKPVGSDNIYEGKIYYNVDKQGDPYLISFYIIGLPNGKGEFYQRKQYPMSTEEKIGNITYKYSMPINGSGQAFFNLICDKCR